MEKVLAVSCIFQTIIIIVVTSLKKYFKKFSFRNFEELFVIILIQDLNHKFENTFFEEQSR